MLAQLFVGPPMVDCAVPGDVPPAAPLFDPSAGFVSSALGASAGGLASGSEEPQPVAQTDPMTAIAEIKKAIFFMFTCKLHQVGRSTT